MKCSLAFLVLSTQVLYAGLERYSHLVVADVSPAAPAGGEVRVTYLGTNGFQFESGNHALLVDPYFSRINLWRVVLGSSVQPDEHRIDDAMKHLASKVDAILVTHGHVDHLLDAPVLMRKTEARLIGSRTAVELAGRAGVPASRCHAVTEGDVLRVGPWRIRAFTVTHDRLFWIVPFAGEAARVRPATARRGLGLWRTARLSNRNCRRAHFYRFRRNACRVAASGYRTCGSCNFGCGPA